MMTMAAMNKARGFVLNSEVDSTLKGFMCKQDQAEAKAKKLSDELQVIGSTSTMLGYENESLWTKIETVVSTKAVLKIKLDAAAEDVRQAERRVLEAQEIRRAARRPGSGLKIGHM
ncbi:hypothetical protein Adt_42111 [Abeliophyllum distichum]|uniref:Uncharacterized protein n=1 Tax=Abeliophyllum distichum TaxID=126358 RepID=A0ABD1PQR4_9LAMI